MKYARIAAIMKISLNGGIVRNSWRHGHQAMPGNHLISGYLGQEAIEVARPRRAHMKYQKCPYRVESRQQRVAWL